MRKSRLRRVKFRFSQSEDADRLNETANKKNKEQVVAKNSMLDVIIVGAGFAGLFLLHRMKQNGFTARIIEAGDGVGGTWYWNRYPGARCDVESTEYSYQFSDELQQEWDWSERYATQPELLKYVNHVADRFHLRPHIQLNTRVTRAVFDEENEVWSVSLDTGEKLSARFCVMATGCLSSANIPDIDGLADFAGEVFHTGNWPHHPVDFSGKKVGVIGTGSSAIQSIPLIAEDARHLYVFQRTPSYAVPAHNKPLDEAYRAAVKKEYPARRQAAQQTRSGMLFQVNPEDAMTVSEADRRAEYDRRWKDGGLAFLGAYNDLLVSRDANDTAAEYIREKIREIVPDPSVAKTLSPDTVVGCKRLCVDTGYYETYNRSNVSLVDVKASPIERITARGLRTQAEEYALDTLIFATGFDAMTGALLKIDIRGRGGRSIAEKWEEGPKTYLGLAMAGFPNLFIVTGPGSPSVLANMMPSIEQHVNWITDCLTDMRAKGRAVIEADQVFEEDWVSHVNATAGKTLFPTCNSWYLGANIPGKPRVFMPYLGYPAYVKRCNNVAATDYEGFSFA
ncbi:MAG: cyclohexanone monooxygenase [Sneathiella sp.]